MPHAGLQKSCAKAHSDPSISTCYSLALRVVCGVVCLSYMYTRLPLFSLFSLLLSLSFSGRPETPRGHENLQKPSQHGIVKVGALFLEYQVIHLFVHLKTGDKTGKTSLPVFVSSFFRASVFCFCQFPTFPCRTIALCNMFAICSSPNVQQVFTTPSSRIRCANI